MMGLSSIWLSAVVGSMIGASGVHFAAPVAATDPSTIDAAIEGLYASISGPVGQERDWDAFYALMAKEARMGAIAVDDDGKATYIELTPREYHQRSGPWLVEHGFTEEETHRVLEIYGSVAHAWSTYRGTFEDPKADDGKGVLEGINSIQLIQQGGRWQIVSIRWESTQTAGPIPAKYGGK